MLVLGRKEGEAIVIGEDIVVVFLRDGKGGARIGIEAPGREISRAELLPPDVLAKLHRKAFSSRAV